jgi:hypothetical protein
MFISAAAIGLLALAQSGVEQLEPFARSDRDIPAYCRAQADNELLCRFQQRGAMVRFIAIFERFDDPQHQIAMRCIDGAKVGRYVNWLVAEQCAREATGQVSENSRTQ